MYDEKKARLICRIIAILLVDAISRIASFPLRYFFGDEVANFITVAFFTILIIVLIILIMLLDSNDDGDDGGGDDNYEDDEDDDGDLIPVEETA